MNTKIFQTLIIISFVALGFGGSAFAGPLEDWQAYEVSVRDGNIPKVDAQLKLDSLVPELSSYVLTLYELGISSWAFPLDSYGRGALEKTDFQPNAVYGPYNIKGYDFFDGNKHGGHPAHDIFIRDKFRRCLDDVTNQPVRALAMEDCVVLFVNKVWEPKSKLRGGKYVWLYNPKDNKFFYYAHLNDIFVEPGRLVKKGEALGIVGRTGRLADMKTSPTHVHLMVLEYREGVFVPYDYYNKISDKR